MIDSSRKSRKFQNLVCVTACLPVWFLFQSADPSVPPDALELLIKTCYRKNIAQIAAFYRTLAGSILRTGNSYAAGFMNHHFFFDTELFFGLHSWLKPVKGPVPAHPMIGKM
jgi:hypothetical protein